MIKLLTYLIIFGILSIQSMYGKPDETILTEKDNDGFIGIAVGDILILKLETNLGTGYAWHVVGNDSDLLELSKEPKLEPIEEDTKKDEKAVKKEEIPLVGHPEYMVFRFKAQRSGINILRMSYFRTHEKEKRKPSKVFNINVEIY